MRARLPSLSYRSLAGFTLLEILIVIVIVGVIISIATIASGVLGRDREMQDQAERLSAVLTQAKEECELQGFDVGLRITPESYDFLRFDNRKQIWTPITDDDFFAARQLPAGLKFRLWLEGREVILKPTVAKAQTDSGEKSHEGTADLSAESDNAESSSTLKDDKPQEDPPQVMVLSSGDVNAFKLQLDREGTGSHWQVYSKPDSTLVVEPADEEI